MTREDIDNIISIICPNDKDFEKPIISPAYLKKELETLALEQEPSGDAISRADAIEAIASRDITDGYEPVFSGRQVIALLNDLDSVNPQESKTGHWITEDMFDGDVAYRCSECNELFWIESGTPKDNEYNFCPKCGAKMVEPQESETWNGIHAQITAPKGTFERIFNEADDDNDI